MSEVVKRVEGLAGVEQEHASSLSNSVQGIRNVVVREILRGIAHDTQKHAGFYRAILSVLEEVAPAIDEEDYDRIESVVKEHIEVENRMIQRAKQLLDSLQDSRIKHLLTEIYSDEIKHHALMKRILGSIIRREAIFEAEFWDAIWKDVPGHGAPF